jgi:uncharacterized protein (DUF58 family)
MKGKITPRAGTLLVAAVVLYFFANQTQVGWLYLMAAVLASCVGAAWWVNRGVLKTITLDRGAHVADPAPYPLRGGATARLPDTFHVGDTVAVTLRMKTRRDTAQLLALETCAFRETPASSVEQLYIPRLPSHTPIEYTYTAPIERRGVCRFDALDLTSSAPFGIFRRAGRVPAPASYLVYPEVRALSSLDFLDHNRNMPSPRTRAGYGSEVIGARPYRHGDSPRHIHWRATARSRELISKEFADDAQPTLLLALDCYAHPTIDQAYFELGVKAATALGEYALRNGYALLLATEMTTNAAPLTPASWHTLLETLARVTPTGERRLSDVLRGRGAGQIAVVLPHPDDAVIAVLASLRASGSRILAVVIEQDEFAARLRGVGVDVRLLREDNDWRTALAGQIIEAEQKQGVALQRTP